jgi:hypothetical protein
MGVSSGQAIPEKAPGTTITAEEWNTLVREVNAMRGVRVLGDAGAGGRVTRSGGSMVLSLNPTRKAWVIPGIIKAAPAYAPTWPADAVYTAAAVGEPDLVLEDVLPTFHRLVASEGGPEGKGPSGIMPAKVDDRCYIHWITTDEGELEAHLECPTETLHVVACETAAASARANGGGSGAGGGGGGGSDDDGSVVVVPGDDDLNAGGAGEIPIP